MFHRNFRKKSTQLCHFFSYVCCVGFAVVLDLQSNTIEYKHL